MMTSRFWGIIIVVEFLEVIQLIFINELSLPHYIMLLRVEMLGFRLVGSLT